MPQPQGVIDDRDVRSALDWFLDVAPDRGALQRRMELAHECYRAGSTPNGLEWPQTSRLILGNDVIASYLAQCSALLGDRRLYDGVLGARIVPFMQYIGQGVELLRRWPGSTARLRRLLNPGQEHPDAGLFELAAAVRYAQEDFEVEFMPESTKRAGDLAIRIAGIPRAMGVECRRLRCSAYELRERACVQRQFARLAQLIHARRLSIDVDLRFTAELTRIPRDYLAERVMTTIGSPSLLEDGCPWRDEWGEGVVRAARLDRVEAAIKHGALLFGAEVARSLTARTVEDGAFLTAIQARPSAEDPRYVEEVAYASVLTWRCVANESVDATARHIRSELVDIDQQLGNAEVGIAHIAMDGEHDTMTAGRRRERNLDAVRKFIPRSRVAELHLHRYVRRVAAGAPWATALEETVDRHSRWHQFLLEDSRILAIDGSELGSGVPAWNTPPTPIPGKT